MYHNNWFQLETVYIDTTQGLVTDPLICWCVYTLLVWNYITSITQLTTLTQPCCLLTATAATVQGCVCSLA